uniref:ATP synthase F0 subunit 8 n=1 Tax=Bothriechis nubestris TaxID=1766655 RepID=A0A5B8H9F3_9SAUR|nr:ATP synthase F0 subunit 8 [Bothriechis nubestris]QDX17826.1 ATP synthase F0 subunit 8 [Bothriechis nubestris]
MPQLDTMHILTIYLWTWLTLILTTLKIKTFALPIKPKKQPPSTPQLMMPPTPWT